MGIEYSSAFSGKLRRVVWPRCSGPTATCNAPSGVVGRGWRGELGMLDGRGTMPDGCPDTRVVRAHVSLGWGAGVVEYGFPFHDESTVSIGG
jgi:hypothetical protein